LSASLTIGSVSASAQTQVQSVLDLALRGLEPMFDPSRAMFCSRLRLSADGLVQEGHSYRYTLMTLLGLHRAAAAGPASPIDCFAVYNALHNDGAWPDNAGDLGLYLWLCALQAPGQLQQVLQTCNLPTALRDCADARQRCTMELAWVLSGLAHAQLAGTSGADLRPQALHVYDLLRTNQGPWGLFGHQASRGVVGSLRGRIGSFADQVYPIYALAKFAEAFDQFHEEALARARACADAICRLQGPLGQWWWHYDSSTGRVLGDYPVYSVHQDAMAPMALFALADAAGLNFDGPIYKGLNWIFGGNEMGRDLRDPHNTLVWRSLFESKVRTRCNELFRFAGLSRSARDLRINYEDRPYHLGWVLYAFAGRELAPATRGN
jgi:hypothetical protein